MPDTPDGATTSSKAKSTRRKSKGNPAALSLDDTPSTLVEVPAGPSQSFEPPVLDMNSLKDIAAQLQTAVSKLGDCRPVQVNDNPRNPNPSLGGTVSLANELPAVVIDTPAPKQKHHALSSALASRVPDKIKNQIWAGGFIELGLMLFPGSTRDVELSLGGTMLKIPSTSRPKQLRDIDQWSDAFIIYMAVLLEKPDNVHLAGPMLHYLFTVRELARRTSYWYDYDFKFRSVKDVDDIHWDQIHHEFYLQALAKNMQSSNFQGQGSNQSRYYKQVPGQAFQGKQNKNSRWYNSQGDIPRGFCYSFHSGFECPNGAAACPFSHICPQCNDAHSASRCPRDLKSTDRSGNTSKDQIPASRGQIPPAKTTKGANAHSGKSM